MYYILNETNQLIAADEEMLSLCGAAHIDDLSSKIIKGDISLHLTDETTLSLQTEDSSQILPVSKISLSSLLGYMHLVHVKTDTHSADSMDAATSTENLEHTELIDSIIHDAEDENEEVSLEEENIASSDQKETEEDEITFGDHLDISDDILGEQERENAEEKPLLASEDEEETELFQLLDDNSDRTELPGEESSEEKTQTEPIEKLDLLVDENSEDEILDLGLSDESQDSEIQSIEETEEADSIEITINIDEVSKEIGISTDDYQDFLNEFIDTALGLEKDIQSSDTQERLEATNTLLQLSEVLHLPAVGDIITQISHADDTNQRSLIESFYNTLSRITTTHDQEESISVKDVESPVETEAEEEKLELFDEVEDNSEALIIQDEITPTETSSGAGFGTISLEGIRPKHFDFQLEEAANELSLPVELIEEFVHDFINQAHIETKNMLKAYENGDLESIQKIGHLLKGASSNLRINPLSETLYKIQFCEDPSQLEMLIKDYWAHFLSFENQINMISH